MKKGFFLVSILIIAVFFTVGCQKDMPATESDGPSGNVSEPVSETPNTLPPSIMVDGELYFSTGEEMPIEPAEIAIKTVTSVVKDTELPSKDGEINFSVPDAKYAKINNYKEYVVVIMDLKWVRFEKKADETTYDKLSAYMKEECKTAFSPYYELLDFKISNYEEEVVNGNVEAVFFYTLISKNYDKDPDTVDYIKEAKESGNENYQQMYDEYLQPKEMNFHLKTVIGENGSITLYSNISPIGIEWEETKMTDFILSN